MSYFSSRGYATGTNAMKPEIVAPGSGVRSAYNSSDSAYATMNDGGPGRGHRPPLFNCLVAAVPTGLAFHAPKANRP